VIISIHVELNPEAARCGQKTHYDQHDFTVDNQHDGKYLISKRLHEGLRFYEAFQSLTCIQAGAAASYEFHGALEYKAL
jgi:hypothetical protein